MGEKNRIVVIGHTNKRNFGHDFHTVWQELANCELATVAGADEERLKSAAAPVTAPKAYADYRKMLDEVRPQIVAIGPRWLDQHRDMVLAAAQRCIHI